MLPRLQSLKMSGIASSGAAAGNQKASMFAAKSGFVIPKNKLSGSLVPVFRGGKKHGGTEANDEENTNKMQRKTKWGPDLLQDATVRRGRALAFQVRVDQISRQLESRTVELVNTRLLDANPETSCTKDNKSLEMLELEKREVIGEILKLNPSYKAPPGFKPLLKKATVPLPVKQYPGYNFIALVYGPKGDNQKHLEKETGAQVQVHGIKAETGEKVEIKPSEGNDMQHAYEELSVHISADSFEKIDAAESVIEMLINSLIGNLGGVASTPSSAAENNLSVPSESQGTTNAVTLVNQGLLQPREEPLLTSHGPFQHCGPWFSPVLSRNAISVPSFINVTPNSSNLAHTGPSNLLSPAFNPRSMPFTPRPAPAFGSNSIAQNSAMIPRGSESAAQVFQHPSITQATPLGGLPRNPPVYAVQLPSAQALQSPSQQRPLGAVQSSTPSTLPSVGISARPFVGPPIASSSLNLSNMGQITSPVVPLYGPRSLYPQTNVTSPLQPVGPRATNGPPQTSFSPLHAGSGPTPAYSSSSANTIQGSILTSPGMPFSHVQTQHSGVASSVSGTTPCPRPFRPPPPSLPLGSVNFTFHPHRPDPTAQGIFRPSIQASTQNAPQERHSGLHASHFRQPASDQHFNQAFPRPPLQNHLDQAQAHLSSGSFNRMPNSISFPPPQTGFPYASQSAIRNAAPQRAPMYPGPGPLVPGALKAMYPQPSYPSQQTRPDFQFPMNQKFNNQSFGPGRKVFPTEQIYDPFSPTSREDR